MQMREEWARWAAVLQRYHLDQLTAWVLEAGGPFALLGAQALYFGRPFLGASRARVDALARTLEDEDQVRGFIACLHAGRAHG